MKDSSLRYSRYFTYVKPFAQIPVIKNYGPVIFALITISVLTLFAVKPTVETILVLQKQLANQEEVLKKITEKANNLSLGKKNYDDLEQRIKQKIILYVPDNPNVKSAIEALEEAAKVNEASVSALQIQPILITSKVPHSRGTLAEISFIFNTEGPYQNLINLLRYLKRSSRLISIESLSLQRSSSENNTLIMSLTGKAYYLK